VVTALGSPKHVIEQVHAYGGLVLADVTSTRYAHKAAAAGVDGLILVAAGAGGHTGQLSAFAFVDEVRQWWDGLLILGGGIGSGSAIHAAQTMGADIALLGTRFIATRESLCQEEYKAMVVASNADDIVTSAAITGVKANWMRQSLSNAGYDPDAMPEQGSIDFASNGADNKRWKDIWAAGQGVATTQTIDSVANVINQLTDEYQNSVTRMADRSVSAPQQ
jgi:nitronate monooxygenase